MERMGGISRVGGGEMVATGDKKDKGDGVGKSGPLGGGMYSGSQSSAHSVGKKRWEVHLGVATLEGRVSGNRSERSRW